MIVRVSFLERLPLLEDQRARAYLIAVLLSLVAAWARHGLEGVLPPGFPYLTFFPAVIISSFLFGRGPGIAAGILCGLIAWYFFIAPDGFALDVGAAVALAFYAGVIGVDILLVHWMQRANLRLRKERARSDALAERAETLFKELQHRVSNNLQMAGAVLNLQKRGIADPDARRLLDDTSTKIQMIGRIQRQLYDTSGKQVALDAFLNDLASDLVAANGNGAITYSVAVEPGVTIDPDALIPLSLVMAEGVANAVEHGFGGGRAGHIDIAVRRQGRTLDLTIKDDGHGLPAGFDCSNPTSLGLQIAGTLARQLDGRFEVMAGTDKGTVTRLTVPAALAG